MPLHLRKRHPESDYRCLISSITHFSGPVRFMFVLRAASDIALALQSIRLASLRCSAMRRCARCNSRSSLRRVCGEALFGVMISNGMGLTWDEMNLLGFLELWVAQQFPDMLHAVTVSRVIHQIEEQKEQFHATPRPLGSLVEILLHHFTCGHIWLPNLTVGIREVRGLPKANARPPLFVFPTN
jgi:hypothetical protein